MDCQRVNRAFMTVYSLLSDKQRSLKKLSLLGKLKLTFAILASLFWVWFVVGTLKTNSPPPEEYHAPERPKTAQEVGAAIDPMNSTVLLDVGYGQFIRVPKSLFGKELDNFDSNIVKKSGGIALSLMYPEMVYADSSPSRPFLRKKTGDLVTPKNTFRVFFSLFYSPDDLKDSKNLPGPAASFRPSRMLFNRTCVPVVNGTCANPTVKTPSKISGLDTVYLESSIKKDPELLNAPLENGATYVVPDSADYDLLLDCDSFEGMKCEGQVFIKKNRFQYSISFPPGEVGSAKSLINKLNNMVDVWLLNKQS